MMLNSTLLPRAFVSHPSPSRRCSQPANALHTSAASTSPVCPASLHCFIASLYTTLSSLFAALHSVALVSPPSFYVAVHLCCFLCIYSAVSRSSVLLYHASFTAFHSAALIPSRYSMKPYTFAILYHASLHCSIASLCPIPRLRRDSGGLGRTAPGQQPRITATR